MFAASFAFHLWHCFNQLVLFDQWETQFSIISEAINEPVLTRVNPSTKKKNFSSYIKWILCLLVCSVTYCLWRCQSYISHLLTGSISRSRLTEQAFELYSLLLLGNETEMSVQLWRGSGRGAVWRASAFTPAAGGVSAAKHTDSLPRNTLFTSVSVQQGASGTGANRGWPEGATVTPIQLLPPATGPPFSGIFKLE